MSRRMLTLLAIGGLTALTQAQPGNDNCAGAIAVVNGVNPGLSNRGATESPEAFGCGGSTHSDVWFTYVATGTGTTTFETCSVNTNFDTKIQVLEGSCGAQTSLGCNDDNCPAFQSSIDITTTAGTTYYVRVGGFNGAQGDFDLTITAPGSPPANDECAGAVSVAFGINGTFTNQFATDSAETWTCSSQASKDVWYVFSGCPGDITVETCSPNTNFDTKIEVFEGTCGALTSIACNDDSCGLASSVTFAGTLGAQYYVRVGGFGGGTGDFDLTITCVIPNDECSGAIPVGDGVNGPFTNVGATDSPEAASCGLGGGRDLWYAYTATCTGTVRIETCTATRTFDTAISLWDGTCGALTQIACNDDFCGLGSSMTASVTAGTTYYIKAGAFNGFSSGDFDLVIYYDNGTGSFTSVAPGCGPATLSATGAANLGGLVNYSVVGGVGTANITWLGTSLLAIPICPGCDLGTEQGVIFPPNIVVSALIPCDPVLIGASWYFQGADVIGTTGGCDFGGGLDFTLTDTVQTTVGN